MVFVSSESAQHPHLQNLDTFTCVVLFEFKKLFAFTFTKSDSCAVERCTLLGGKTLAVGIRVLARKESNYVTVRWGGKQLE